VTVGQTDLLQARYEDYEWNGFHFRLAAREGHSVALQISRSADGRTDHLHPNVALLNPGERLDRLRRNVRHDSLGDLRLEGVPSANQGNTPYCGIHALAMTAQYLGLTIPADEFAAAAEFKNTGSARGSRVLDLYRAAAEEAGMDLKTSSRFDGNRLTKSLESGLPVIVWRRVTSEREEAHHELANRLTRHPHLHVPASDPLSWPRRESKRLPSHGSVITGYNAERGEVIYCEPWGAATRNRRMSAGEMEASVYAVFY
jgi:hypothetical protein